MILLVAAIDGNSNKKEGGERRKKAQRGKIHFHHFIITSEVRKG
jgi:hypothetical protein